MEHGIKRIKRRQFCGEISIPLKDRIDKNGNCYFIAWPDPPVTLNLEQCVFFVFTGDKPQISIRRKHDIEEVIEEVECDDNCCSCKDCQHHSDDKRLELIDPEY